MLEQLAGSRVCWTIFWGMLNNFSVAVVAGAGLYKGNNQETA